MKAKPFIRRTLKVSVIAGLAFGVLIVLAVSSYFFLDWYGKWSANRDIQRVFDRAYKGEQNRPKLGPIDQQDCYHDGQVFCYTRKIVIEPADLEKNRQRLKNAPEIVEKCMQAGVGYEFIVNTSYPAITQC